jgi:imidazolonepropionase-like amidohydrolase
LVAGFVLLISLFGFAQEKPVALKGGKLLTVTHGVLENGVLLIQDGKIAAVGTAASVKIPKDARVIDVTGMTIYPA